MSKYPLLGLRSKQLFFGVWIATLGIATLSFEQAAAEGEIREASAATSQEAISKSNTATDESGDVAKDTTVKLEVLICSPRSGVVFGINGIPPIEIAAPESTNAEASNSSQEGLGIQEELEKDVSDCSVISSFLKSVERKGIINIQTTSTLITKAGNEAKILFGSRERAIELQVTPSLIGDTISLHFRSSLMWEEEPSKKTSSENVVNPYPVINRKTPNTIDPVDTEGAVWLKRESAVDLGEGASKKTSNEFEEDRYPVVNSRSVKGSLNIKDGKTILVGHSCPRHVINSFNSELELSDVYMLGNLLQTVEKRERDVEVAIFISASIVKE